MGRRTKAPPFHWALFTLILAIGSEGEKLQQQTVQPHEGNQDTNRWIPLPRDRIPGAQTEFELMNQKGDGPPIRFVDQALIKMQRDEDLVHQKKSQKDGILKRRHGLPQVGFHLAFKSYFYV